MKGNKKGSTLFGTLLICIYIVFILNYDAKSKIKMLLAYGLISFVALFDVDYLFYANIIVAMGLYANRPSGNKSLFSFFDSESFTSNKNDPFGNGTGKIGFSEEEMTRKWNNPLIQDNWDRNNTNYPIPILNDEVTEQDRKEHNSGYGYNRPDGIIYVQGIGWVNIDDVDLDNLIDKGNGYYTPKSYQSSGRILS